MLTNEENDFLDALYRKYEQRLFWISYEILGCRRDNQLLAEDCVQQTFEISMRKLRSLKASSVPYFWLRQTCRNISRAESRKLAIRNRILNNPVPFEETNNIPNLRNDIAEWLLTQELLQKEKKLLSTLTRKEAAVYQAVYKDHLTTRDAALLLHISEGAVRGARQRIKDKLVKLY